MERKKILLVFFVAFISLAFCFEYFQKTNFLNKRGFAQELLQKATFEERELLCNFCKELFCNSTVGYSLFWDKPISVISDFDKPGVRRRHFFLKRVLPLLRRVEKKLHTVNFIILLEDVPGETFLYLVNKKAFLNVVHQNIAIFRTVLGSAVTPKSLLHTIEKKAVPLKQL